MKTSNIIGQLIFDFCVFYDDFCLDQITYQIERHVIFMYLDYN